jgi:hypothetical protein
VTVPPANGGTKNRHPHHPTKHHHPSQGGKKSGGGKSKQPATKLKLPKGRFLALGDSVMLGCSSELRKALDNRVTVDAVVARQIDDTIKDLDQRRAKWGSLPKTIVIQIGNNGPLWYADLVRLKHALRGVPDVIVVNVRNSTSWQDESNSAIVHWVQGWRQAHIADWYGHSKDSMLSDGTHPWPWACKTYAHVIATTLRQSTRTSA